jgi:hypothetical protein
MSDVILHHKFYSLEDVEECQVLKYSYICWLRGDLTYILASVSAVC